MKSMIIKWVLVVVMSLCIKGVSGQGSIIANDKSTLRLRQFRQEYCKSFMDGKPERMQVYFADTIRLMPSFQKTIIGKGNTLAYQKAFLSRFAVHKVTRNEIETLDLGNQILETGTFSLRLTLKSNGKEYTLLGKYLNLWQESESGELLLLTDAWNYDQFYGEIHDQLRFEEISAIHAALLPNVPINSNISFELAALNRLLDATVTNHDSNTWSLYYSDSSMLLASYYPVLKGKPAIDHYLSSHANEMPVFEELDIRNDRIDNLGTYVIEYASHIASWKNGGSSGVSLGKNIRVWRREPDHSLKLFRSIGMYD